MTKADKGQSQSPTNWQELQSEFINGSMSLAELAEKHQVNDATVRSRAARENWQHLRNELQLIATQKTNELIISQKVDQLKALNDIDLSAAELLRQKAALLLQEATTPNEVKALAGVYDIAQKISRLALGASTENSSVTTKETPTSIDELV